MEILGAVAAAIQLAQVGTKVIKLPFLLLSQFQDAPTSVQKRENQIQHLVAIARAIECSTALQTKLIESLLRRCSQEAKYLKALLTPLIAGSGMRKIARNWKAIAGVMKEKRISATYKRLEEEKSALTLCIVSIDALVSMSTSPISYSTIVVMRRPKSAIAFTKSSSNYLQFKT